MVRKDGAGGRSFRDLATRTPHGTSKGPRSADTMTTQDRDEAVALVAEFLRNAQELVAAQRDVLIAHLLGTAADVPAPPDPVALPVPVRTVAAATTAPSARADGAPGPEAETVRGVPARTGAPASPGGPARTGGPLVPAGRKDMVNLVAEVISERTGYPVDMLDADLDLEADLSIDSIRRAEIAGQVSERVGLDPANLSEAEIEELAQRRSVSAIAAWLAARLGGGEPGHSDNGHSDNGHVVNGFLPVDAGPRALTAAEPAGVVAGTGDD